MTKSSRRDFLGIAAAGSALAASGVLSAGVFAAPVYMSQGGGGVRSRNAAALLRTAIYNLTIGGAQNGTLARPASNF